MARVKQDMTAETYSAALALARRLHDRYHADTELNLCGIGESTMHPDFIGFLHLARAAMPRVTLILATNGVALTEEQAKALASCHARTWVSLHRPEKAGPAVELLRRHGTLAGVSADPSIAAVDWAGQVAWHVSTPVRSPCPWLSNGWAFVASNGDLLSCCFDGSGASELGTIWDDPETIELRPHALCARCHHAVPMTEMRTP
jgi:hypothetical protein